MATHLATNPPDPTRIPVNHHGTNHMHLLGERLFNLYNKDTFYDVTLKMKGKVFKAHRVILAAGSDYFHTMFTSGFQEKQSSEILLEYGDRDIFESLLEFIYTGDFNVNPDDIVDTLEMANYYQIQHAVCACADYLAKDLTHVLSKVGSTDQNCSKTPEMIIDELARVISLASDTKQENLLKAVHEYVKAQLRWIVAGAIEFDMPMSVLSVILDQGEELAKMYSEEEV